MTQNKKFFDFVAVVREVGEESFRHLECDVGFERIGDGARFRGRFDRLGDARASVQPRADAGERGVGSLGFIDFWEKLQVDRFAGAVEAPRFFGSKREDGSEQAAEGFQDFVHGGLRSAAAEGAGVVAVEPVFGDVHILAAEFDGAELRQKLIDFVKF